MDIRRLSLPVVLWVFGIATTVALISVWGRAVASDTALLSSAASEAGSARIVADRVEDWIIGALDESTGAAGVVPVAMSRPEVEAAVSNLIEDVVVAASMVPGVASVDVAAHLAPLAPVIAAEADQMGVALSASDVEVALSSIEPLSIRSETGRPLVGPSSGVSRAFYLATAVALVVMAISGAGAVALSGDRRGMLRSLLNRVALSGLSFAIITRLGSWVLDPGGGRSPARTALAQLVGAKWWIPIVVAVVVAAAAVAVGRGQTVRPEAVSPTSPGRAILRSTPPR